MKEAEERIWKLRTGALIYDLTWSRDSVSISPEITGGRQSQQDELKSVKFQSEKDYVQHRQEQTAQVHTVRDGDGDSLAEEEDHNFCHGAGYWESVG